MLHDLSDGLLGFLLLNCMTPAHGSPTYAAFIRDQPIKISLRGEMSSSNL